MGIHSPDILSSFAWSGLWFGGGEARRCAHILGSTVEGAVLFAVAE